MPNFFEKRATEYLRDSEGDVFLALVTPEPLKTFLEPPAQQERLYDRLSVIVGTPGSGKTTIATLLQFHLVDALRRNEKRTGYKELLHALLACRAIDDDGRPMIVGTRLPLEAEYRDFWQLPYSEATRTRLVLTLIQARAILGWLRNIEATEHYSEVRFVARKGSEAAASEIGGLDIASMRKRAAEVERAVYGIGAALVPPATEADFAEAARSAYRPFDVIEGVELRDTSGMYRLRPLVMLDDAHTLHHDQLAAICRDLARRELRIARWVLTRLDVLSPPEALLNAPVGTTSGDAAAVQLGRDVTEIAMQKGADRARQRRAFRRMAQDMADRYLHQMPEFAQRGHDRFADLLATEPSVLAKGDLAKLAADVDKVAKSLGIARDRRKTLEEETQRYVSGSQSPDVGPDVQLAMLRIMMHRHAKRVPQGLLFDAVDVDPKQPVKADAGVADGARVHLLHEFGRPLFFGIESVCDASSENAEQFLRFAGRLVGKAQTRLLRNRPPVLDARLQHTELVEQATLILDADFPYAAEARALANTMAAECLKRSLEPNASLGGGASAIGVPQDQFNAIVSAYPRLARVLQFAVAYNVIQLAQEYGQGNKVWCLLELGGAVLLKNGLTLKRGGFLERATADLDAMLPAEDV